MGRESTRRRTRKTVAQSSELPPPTALIDGKIAQDKMEEMVGSDFWSGLPYEIEERMLSFLSVPVLCRFRTVCKRWNSLICTPEFGALCVQNASAQTYIVARCVGEIECGCGNIFGWRFLDLNARRWYTIKDEIKHGQLYDSRSLAMDGGLVCAYYLDVSDQVDPFWVVVSNPISKTTRRLPSSSYYKRTHPLVTPVMDMVVSNATQDYKVFLMPCIIQRETPPFRVQRSFGLDIYESTTNQWRSSTKAPSVTGICFRVWCSVIFEGMLYVVISPLAELEEYWQLWSYYPAEDAWKHTGAQSGTRIALVHPQLIVANNRLYLVAWMLPWDWNPSIRPTFDIIEILLVEGTCKKVSTFCQRAELEVRRKFKLSEQIERLSIEECIGEGGGADFGLCLGDIMAFGFGKCIILISRTNGISVEIDLVTCGWEVLPLQPLHCDRDLWYVKAMNLILPSALWWQGGAEL